MALTMYEAGNQVTVVLKKVIDWSAKFITEDYSGKLEALILIGSFARGEGVVLQSSDNPVFLSDIEFWAVAKPDSFNRLRDISGKTRDYLRSLGVDIKLSIGLTTKKHLKKLKPCIFTVEVKRFGKVLWGDKKVLDNIPDYSKEDIVPLDGFILLNNRIVEQLMLLVDIHRGKEECRYEL